MRRAPIITIMGHVDHGKTTLLDAFRTDYNKCAEEYGAITQSIGAFTISAPEFTRNENSPAELTNQSEGEVTFIDTPGHEAFVNLRSRGAKVTDIIVLVISAVESVQKQTIEVIELARKMHVPLIVAINKIDRMEADVEAVLLDLQMHDVIPEQLGGDIICVPISAKERVNLNLLREKINEVANERVNLIEDFTVQAQCIVIESNINEKTSQITASVIIKRGTLRQEDIFVSGIHEGKIQKMMNDKGQIVKEAYPGEAVHISGFKHFPDVGNPLYVVKDSKEAHFIVQRVNKRAEQEALTKLAASQTVHVSEIKKSVGKLTRIEKSRIKAGDKTILYEKLGLVEEKDLLQYQSKF